MVTDDSGNTSGYLVVLSMTVNRYPRKEADQIYVYVGETAMRH